MSYVLSDYVELSPFDARAQWRSILSRREVGPGENQVDYLPLETLLCAAAMVALGHVSYGSGLAAKGPTPIPELAAVFRRRRTSITSKMANLEGGRSRGGKTDQRLWRHLSADHQRLLELYLMIMSAARTEGVAQEVLPDFMGVEDAGLFTLLGQDELDDTALEMALREALTVANDMPSEDRPSEREIIARARIGQHRFAAAVLANCGWECVFCGFSLGSGPTRTLLRASHIKPWSASSGPERHDVRNGVAACPVHDAAFDVGDLTLGDDLAVVQSGRLEASANTAVRTLFTAPLLRTRVMLPPGHRVPGVDYVRWHRAQVFVA